MTRVTTQGECVFCKRKFSKGGMSRHLISCPARQAASQALANKPHMRPAQLFHLRIEGRDNPEYWMDVEIPADAVLYDLDDFLRDMWLECCGHMSAFTIEGHEYVVDEPDFGMMMPGVAPEIPAGEGREEEPVPHEAIQMGLALARMTGVSEEAQAAYKAEIERIVGDHDPDEPLSEEQSMQAVASMGRMLGMDEGIINMVLEEIRSGTLPDDDDFFDEGSMDTPLSTVLKPGLTFTHEYDFGSTTRLTLRVVEQRAGYAPEVKTEEAADKDGESDEEAIDLVTLLAQNEPPKITCGACHQKPAILVCTYCYGPKRWLCHDCALKHEHSEDCFLPVVNSPRVGVCGYDGGVYLELDFGDEEDFEEDDEAATS